MAVQKIYPLQIDTTGATDGQVFTANASGGMTWMTPYAVSGSINGDLSISGNLYVTGNTFWSNTSSYIVSDPLLYIAGNNYISDIVDIGFVANYVNATGANVHTGIFRDAGAKEYYVFEGYDKEPQNNVIDPAGNNFTISVLNATLRTSNVILGGINAISWIRASFDKANTAVTATTLNGANTAVGAGANAYSVLVGTAANNIGIAAFTTANAAVTATTLGGANSAVGAGANAYSVLVGTAANNIGIAAFAKANAAVSPATLDGANTAIGAGANAYSVLVGTAANNIAIAAFTTANSAGGAGVGVAFDRANSAQTIAIAAFTTANSAGGSAAGPAFDRANSAQTIAISAFTQANTNYINLANIITFSNTTSSINSNSGAVIIAGGLGVGGNVYTDERYGFANTTNYSVAYTYYNATTLSLDTVFG